MNDKYVIRFISGWWCCIKADPNLANLKNADIEYWFNSEKEAEDYCNYWNNYYYLWNNLNRK